MTKNFEFQDMFGRIFHMVSSNLILYEVRGNKGCYKLPKGTTDAELEKLMKKSVKDKKDYIFELCKDNPFEEKEDVLY